ncbi:hypothetical protein BKA65DRAFT_554518 [Rhexocercosporidium sp. MPI-PUGE-AT-0058]|nr:hypothetical protein BKA65DRAFT_554518 [Rhexocercosporidium sp. MPI-PUGE-AT-0058]
MAASKTLQSKLWWHAIPAAAKLPTQQSHCIAFTPRAMATISAQKSEWLVILPDQKGAWKRRLELRPQHLDDLSKYPSDFWLWGGPFLQEPPKSNEPLKALGSSLLAWGRSKDEVLAELRKDIYTTNEVWDWEKVQIFPFKSTLRKPM